MSNLNEKKFFDRVPFIDAVGSSYTPDQILKNSTSRKTDFGSKGTSGSSCRGARKDQRNRS